MEIEPEHIPPPRSGRRKYRQTGPSPRQIGVLPLVLWGALAIALGVVLLFFTFWLAIAFTAIGLIFIGVNFIRRLITGRKQPEKGQTSVRFYIER
jgi:membrane protein implicated in regulation of membrane protease activity